MRLKSVEKVNLPMQLYADAQWESLQIGCLRVKTWGRTLVVRLVFIRIMFIDKMKPH